MSFLDDLKKEAEQVKQQQTASQSAEATQRELVASAVRPRLKRLYAYLKETCEQLNVVDPDIHVTYEVRGFGKLGPLRQGEYRVTADNPDKLDKFTLFFSCTRPNQVQFQIDGKETAISQKEYMWGCNLRFTSKMTADGAGVFNMDSFVPVSFEVEADIEEARIVMLVRNLDTLGSSRMVFAPEAVDDEFMEEIAKCIVRKESRFQELAGNTISKEMRMQLQQQLQHERLKRDLEASTSSGEAPRKKKKGLLRSLFKS